MHRGFAAADQDRSKMGSKLLDIFGKRFKVECASGKRVLSQLADDAMTARQIATSQAYFKGRDNTFFT